jgi:DNA replication protein DnaC
MKYALFGYTYQHYLACLLLAMMDVERKIQKITLEADVDHKFDDITISCEDKNYCIQIKDIDGIKPDEISVAAGQIKISGKDHKLSGEINLLFFKNLKISPDCRILGFPAQLKDGVYLISINRAQAEQRISKLYHLDKHRRQLINRFLSDKLDERKLDIDLKHLPSITTFDTRLIDKSIRVARKILDFEQVLHIEGKPGVGKSHLVTQLQKQFRPAVLYRFWISNQDRKYEERLRYKELCADLVKKLFFDQKERSEEDILAELEKVKPTLIIDGLDHVENYRPVDLEAFITFINRASENTRVIVLSRPLRTSTSWRKQILRNWNAPQTRKVLKSLYHLSDYSLSEQIYRMTDGYPILVKYIAEQYKKDGIIPDFPDLETVNSYYNQLFSSETGKRGLTLFLCTRGFVMLEEIDQFLDAYGGSLVKEFIEERPYLFERKLNRVTLYHDSLVTYLRNCAPEYKTLQVHVNSVITQSLLKGQTRFQSRIGHFDLSKDAALQIVKYYSSVDNFKNLMSGLIDFEAIREFYPQLLELLGEIESIELTIRQYYDLSLIINLTSRDHFSTINCFYFTFATALIKEGCGPEQVTSSGYLFGMIMYIKSKDASLLFNVKADGLYDTSHFYRELDAEIEEESLFFDYQSCPFKRYSITKLLSDTRSLNYTENLERILVNLYLHPQPGKNLASLREAVAMYMQGEEDRAAMKLCILLEEKNQESFRFGWQLEKVKSTLKALGDDPEGNEYLNLSLSEYLQKNSEKGAFTLWPELLAYIRLSLHKDRKIDLNSISPFWTKYYQRHDYSLRSIFYALRTLEELDQIDWKDSVELIMHIQRHSEKGYRGLTADYLQQHDPSFMLKAINEFGTGQLRVSWLQLDHEYIEALPKFVYDLEIGEQLHYHRTNRQIELSAIENLLESSKLKLLKRDLSDSGYSVMIKPGDPRAAFLKKHKILYREQAGEKFSPDRSAEERFNEGWFDANNRHLVLQKKLTPVEVALLHEAEGTAIKYPEIFEVFPREQLKGQIKDIFKAALTGKSRHDTSPQSPRLLPGHLLKVIEISGLKSELSDLLESYKKFIALSMYHLPIKKGTI